MIETPLVGELDINGWDLAKALRLMLKGNAVVLERLQSPIVYRGDAGSAMHFPTLMAECDPPRDVAGLTEQLIARKAVTRELGEWPLPEVIARFVAEEFEAARGAFEGVRGRRVRRRERGRTRGGLSLRRRRGCPHGAGLCGGGCLARSANLLSFDPSFVLPSQPAL